MFDLHFANHQLAGTYTLLAGLLSTPPRPGGAPHDRQTMCAARRDSQIVTRITTSPARADSAHSPGPSRRAIRRATNDPLDPAVLT